MLQFQVWLYGYHSLFYYFVLYAHITFPVCAFLIGVLLMQYIQIERNIRTFKRCASYPSPHSSYNIHKVRETRLIGDMFVRRYDVYRCVKAKLDFPPVILGM